MGTAETVHRPIARIVLTGFMGSGKTTVGRVLAARLGWAFADLDDAVERGERLSVPRIFARYGEAHFRRAEAAALASLLGCRQQVIALGGGAPGTEAVASLLRTSPGTVVVYLQAPFETLYQRCTAQALLPETTARPLLGDRSEAARRYEARQPTYAAVAHTITSAENSPGVIAEDIVTVLWRGTAAQVRT